MTNYEKHKDKILAYMRAESFAKAQFALFSSAQGCDDCLVDNEYCEALTDPCLYTVLAWLDEEVQE